MITVAENKKFLATAQEVFDLKNIRDENSMYFSGNGSLMDLGDDPIENILKFFDGMPWPSYFLLVKNREGTYFCDTMAFEIPKEMSMEEFLTIINFTKGADDYDTMQVGDKTYLTVWED